MYICKILLHYVNFYHSFMCYCYNTDYVLLLQQRHFNLFVYPHQITCLKCCQQLLANISTLVKFRDNFPRFVNCTNNFVGVQPRRCTPWWLVRIKYSVMSLHSFFKATKFKWKQPFRASSLSSTRVLPGSISRWGLILHASHYEVLMVVTKFSKREFLSADKFHAFYNLRVSKQVKCSLPDNRHATRRFCSNKNVFFSKRVCLNIPSYTQLLTNPVFLM